MPPDAPPPSTPTRDLLRLMPKTEVHLHLEGTVRPETLWLLSQEHGVELPAPSLEELRKHYVFEGFDTFVTLWLVMHGCFAAPSAYESMVDDFVDECLRQNVRYVEAHFTPYNHERWGPLGGRRALEIVTRRMQEHEARGGPVIRLILDIPSESLPESGDYTARLLEEIANPLVVAIGLGGPEVGYPRTAARTYFERARGAGYAAVAHAGETAGAEHVKQAVSDLKARRIQHGIRAIEDQATLDLLVERDICCDVALTSNTLLTDFQDLTQHPVRRMLRAGVPVTLSTDDPAFFGTDLTREYERAREEVGLSVAELWQINLNGLRYGLGETAVRRRLMLELLEEGERLGLAAGSGVDSLPSRAEC